MDSLNSGIGVGNIENSGKGDRHGNPPDALLQDLSTWREQLARSIARNNLSIQSAGIATAVNRILLCLLILRISGDRGIVPESVLCDIRDTSSPYQRISDIIRLAGDPWAVTGDDSGPVHVEPALIIDDQDIRKILTRLCAADRPYRFNVLSLESVAAVFRQYLGRSIRRTAAHHAMVVNNEALSWSARASDPLRVMVEYSVGETLHSAAAGRSKQEILPVRLIDPSCGSGEALIVAYRNLLRKHEGTGYTFVDRKQILLESIHGVDADPHAVAVTRVLLFLCLCENEQVHSFHEDFFTVMNEMFRDLRHTIQCGDPLVGPDIALDESWLFTSPKDRHTLKPFDWKNGFPEIFAAGGFDAVIGIFPSGPGCQKEWVLQYLQRHYAAYDPAADRSAYFVEKGLSLLRPRGVLGCCMNRSWLKGRAGSPLRSLLRKYRIEEIVDFVSNGAAPEGTPCILRVLNRTAPGAFFAAVIELELSGDLKYAIAAHRFTVNPDVLFDGGWALRDTRREDLLAKVAGAGTPLEEVVMGQMHAGTPVDPAFVIDRATRDRLIREDPRCKPLIRPYVSGGDIVRYLVVGDRFVIIIPRGWTDAHRKTKTSPWRWFKKRHPAIARQLKQSGADRNHFEGREDYWWEKGTDQDWRRDVRPGILFPAASCSPAFAYDPGRAMADETVNVIESSNLYLLGLLNGRLMAFVLESWSKKSGVGPGLFSLEDIRNLPVYITEMDNHADRARQDRIVMLVMRLMALANKLRAGQDEHEAVPLRNEIATIGKKIDALVYDLYHLTKEEIAVIEAAIPSEFRCSPT